MSIDIAPETERVVQEELRSGHFRSLDDLILFGVQAWREKNDAIPESPLKPKQNIVDFFRESPLVGLELDFDRDRDSGRDIAL